MSTVEQYKTLLEKMLGERTALATRKVVEGVSENTYREMVGYLAALKHAVEDMALATDQLYGREPKPGVSEDLYG